MEAARILNELRASGLSVTLLDENHIKVSPADLLTDETRQLIRQYKPELLKVLNGNEIRQIPSRTRVRANGYVCGRCGCLTYRQVMVWETRELETGPWRYEHRPAFAWKCELCGMVYTIIGGSRGPVLIQ